MSRCPHHRSLVTMTAWPLRRYRAGNVLCAGLTAAATTSHAEPSLERNSSTSTVLSVELRFSPVRKNACRGRAPI